MDLWAHQRKALTQLSNGSVLVGGTGSGKSLTALCYYVKEGGFDRESPQCLYIITTAKKRDEGDWVKEAAKIGITNNLLVDSWNNIKKYSNIKESFFIFDEQRLVGSGTWVKSFLKIAKNNLWILLSATPADTWMDLIPVFIANGFYKNRTDFIRTHVLYAPYVTFPKIVGYIGEHRLRKYRDAIFVLMPTDKHTTRHIERIQVDYNLSLVRKVIKEQWHPVKDKPIASLAEETFVIREIINSHPSRIFELLRIYNKVKKLIIFYNYNFELEILKQWFEPITIIGEQNGFKHQLVPEGSNWVYLVQYNSGSEAWECFTTNHMAFYSLNYSYRKMEQARGRIDRHNTLYVDLYYYELYSDAYIDSAIQDAFKKKESFNMNYLKARRSQLL